MATLSFLPTNALQNARDLGVVKLDGTHQFSIRISSVTGDATWDDASDIDELPTSGGYTVGGIELTVPAAVVYDTDKSRAVMTGTDPEWTGSGDGFTVSTLVICDDDANYNGGTGFPCFYCTLSSAYPVAAAAKYMVRTVGFDLGVMRPAD